MGLCRASRISSAYTLPKGSSKKVLLNKKDKKEAGAAWLFLAPGLIGTSVFFLLPFAETVRRSLTDALGKSFCGIENYRSVLANDAFRLAAKNTARFICTCLPLLLCLSLILALAVRGLNKSRPGSGRVFKTTFLLPMAIPVASVVLLWRALFAEHGLCNAALTLMGASPVDFMGTSAAFWVLIFTYLWKNSGYDMILFLAGLDGISPDIYEAAAVDGANAKQVFLYITLPNLMPTAIMTAILSLLNTFKVFREAYLVAGPYPHDSIYLLQHLFNNWFLSLDLPRLSAAAVMVAVMLLIFILLIQRVWKEEP